MYDDVIIVHAMMQSVNPTRSNLGNLQGIERCKDVTLE